MNTAQLTALCQRYQAMLLDADNEVVHIAVVDAPSHKLLDALHFATIRCIDIVCWTHRQIEGRIHIPQEVPPAVATENSASAADLLNQTFHSAPTQRASDIHFEPRKSHYRIRLRIDGVLHTLPEITTEMGTAIVVGLKVLDSLDAVEHRLPQDGRFTVEISGGSISFRITTLPYRYDERIMLRLLHQVDRSPEIAALGIQDVRLATSSQALQQPQGLTLVTGPTESGKTVTLYSALQTQNTPDANLCSVEDPAEIPIVDLDQTQIHPRVGLTLQGVLCALLRQDSDIVMVGEIRDGETVEIALKVAQTGHLILSMLHTNSTSEALVHLQQTGAARWTITSTLMLVIAQRPVGELCPHCRQRQSTPIKLPKTVWPTPLSNWQASGRKHCYHGFYGRTALFEVLPITPALRQSIASGTSVDEMEPDAQQPGIRTLFGNDCRAIEQGLTAFEGLTHVLGTLYIR